MTPIKIILVEPHDARNIGSVARVMKNLGFSELRLVAPVEFDQRMAEVVARGGDSVIKNAQIFNSLEAAVSDLSSVVALSGVDGKERVSPLTLKKWSDTSEVLQKVHTNGSPLPDIQIGLVFGPESTGLRLEHLVECDTIVRIPTSPEYSSLNLSHAVAIVLYELTRSNGVKDFEVESLRDPPATREHLSQLDYVLKAALKKSGFLNDNSPATLEDNLKNIFRRVELSEREVKILTGVFGSVAKV